MGSVKKMLAKVELPSRETHHSRMFIDLAENIHIHHREYRTVFSLDEYFEYVDILNKSTDDVRTFLSNNPHYREREYPTTIMVGGGRAQQLRFLSNSPKPNKSFYYDGEMAVELQDEFVTDEIHIHYRDFRIAMDRSRFAAFAKCINAASDELTSYLEESEYAREFHPDRIVEEFNDNESENTYSRLGIETIPLNSIGSNWYDDLLKEFKPNRNFIEHLVSNIREGYPIAPIILCRDKDPERYLIVDGHHRVYAALEAESTNIPSIVLDMEFNQTNKLREAEVLLKEFDQETGFKYGLSSFFKKHIAYSLNQYFSGYYDRKLFRNTRLFRVLRRIKQTIFGKGEVFRGFNEMFNKE